ncbi:MAG TPA: hypothetical protein VFP65_15000, partial [Anaeromyxobacteraceae bacterium]|nr:hypothetical protein [Anaeromyxobacteraceae bacterium]
GAVTIGTSTQGVPGTGGTTVATGSVWLSAGIDARGGSGASGGLGGSVSLTLDPASAPAGQEIVLFGFKTVDASGGAGPSQGGAGGVIALANEASFANGGTAAGGSVVNATDLVASGGNGFLPGLPADPTKPGTGGAGGSITLDTQTKNAWPGIYPEQAINSGTLTANGGSGRSGGSAKLSTLQSLPAIRLSGRTGVTNAGTLAASGGAASDALAGQGGSVVLSADAGTVDNQVQGGIRADGGGAVTTNTDPNIGPLNTAGDGGTVQLSGASVKNAATISAAGGDATDQAGSAGTGGAIQLTGSRSPAVNDGTLIVLGGTFKTDPRANGTILIDGVLVAP